MNIASANSPLDVGIVYFIKKSGMKQIAVAERAGLDKQALSDMLNGRRIIKACDIPKIAYALGITSNDIYDMGQKLIGEEVEAG